jgi:hypothetical protein
MQANSYIVLKEASNNIGYSFVSAVCSNDSYLMHASDVYSFLNFLNNFVQLNVYLY